KGRLSRPFVVLGEVADEDHQQSGDEERAEDPAEPEHRAGLVELAVAVGGPVGPLFLRLGPEVVVVHAANVLQTRNGAHGGAVSRRGRWFAERIGSYSPTLYPVWGEAAYPRWTAPLSYASKAVSEKPSASARSGKSRCPPPRVSGNTNRCNSS